MNTRASIHFISSQNTVVIDRHACNFILMRELPFWPAKWSDVSGANKKQTHGSYYSAEYIFPDFFLTFQNKLNCFPWLICSCEIPMLAFNHLQ